MSNIYGYIRVSSMNPQEGKPKAQCDWQTLTAHEASLS